MFAKKDKKEGVTKARLMELTIKAVLLNQKKQVLILKRAEKDDSNPGLWDLPGGGIENGETIKEALQREIREETGLEAQVGALIAVSEFSKEHAVFKNEKRGLRFLAFVTSDDEKVQINEKEHQEYKWLDLESALQEFSADNEFEKEKKDTLLAAKEWLRKEDAFEGWKRALADLENFKIRNRKNNEEFKKYCLEDLVSEIIPVLDNFDSAWEHLDEEKKKDNLFLGFFHIKNQLQKILEERGVKELEVKAGDDFDENKHEALVADNEKESQGKIKKVLKKGYVFFDKVIRPAGVEVE